MRKLLPPWINQDDLEIFAQSRATTRRVRLRGIEKQFDLPISLNGTPFRQLVWAQIAAIPYGQTSAPARSRGTSANPMPSAPSEPPRAPILFPSSFLATGSSANAARSPATPAAHVRKTALLDFGAGKSETLFLRSPRIAISTAADRRATVQPRPVATVFST